MVDLFGFRYVNCPRRSWVVRSDIDAIVQKSDPVTSNGYCKK